MKTTTITCLYCDRKFTDSSKDPMAVNRLKANLANHIKGTHPDKYVPRLNPQIVTPATPAPAKLAYERKSKPEVAVNFCPCCGLNLRAVKVAVGL